MYHQHGDPLVGAKEIVRADGPDIEQLSRPVMGSKSIKSKRVVFVFVWTLYNLVCWTQLSFLLWPCLAAVASRERDGAD